MTIPQPDLPRAQGVLRFDWEDIHGQVVRRIIGIPQFPDRAAAPAAAESYWEIVLLTDAHAMSLTVNPDTDEVIAILIDPPPTNGDDLVNIDCLSDLIGHPLGWAWACINSQGYWDMFITSVDSVDPQVVFLGMASALTVMRVNGVARRRDNL
jgi:hypothetical protein